MVIDVVELGSPSSTVWSWVADGSPRSATLVATALEIDLISCVVLDGLVEKKNKERDMWAHVE
uniref:Uncharacterized protein n=1 Tax=Oryza glumipatula TaxID=40148 RepID=A0A0D9YYE6_9ORYZ